MSRLALSAALVPGSLGDTSPQHHALHFGRYLHASTSFDAPVLPPYSTLRYTSPHFGRFIGDRLTDARQEGDPNSRYLDTLQGFLLKRSPDRLLWADENPDGGGMGFTSASYPTTGIQLAGFPYSRAAKPRLLNPTAVGDSTHDGCVAGRWGVRVVAGDTPRSATHLCEDEFSS